MSPGRNLAQHRVVEHRRDLEKHRTQPDQRRAQEEIAIVVPHPEQSGNAEEHQGREHCQRALTAASGIRLLPGNWRQYGDQHPGRGYRPRVPGAGLDRAGQILTHRVGQVDREHEGDNHRVEAGRPPVPQPPREDLALRGLMEADVRPSRGSGIAAHFLSLATRRLFRCPVSRSRRGCSPHRVLPRR
jgi:hypothetical protein